MKRVLITGAAGYVGRAFTQAHRDRYRLEPFVGDVRDAEAVGRACRGTDAVLHLAGVTTDRPGATDADFFSVNTVGTFNVLEAAVKAGTAQVVFASSVCAVGFRPTSRVILETDPCEPSDGMYGVSKHLAERLCEAYAARPGVRVLCLRLAMVVPQHDLARPRDPSAPAWLGAVHIDDVVEAFRLALDDGTTRHGVFHVASGSPHSKFDITLARRVLGYAPRHPLDDALPSRAAGLAKGALRRVKRALGLR